MLTLTTRPYQGEADLQAIADLINTCEAIDKLEQGTSVSELQSEFDTPSVDRARDFRLWENADGKLIGFGQLWITEPSETIDGYLSFHIHPDFRGENLHTEIIQWSEDRMREVEKEKNSIVKLRSHSKDCQTDRISILEDRGFRSDRYFFTLERNLAEPIPSPQFPSGFMLRNMNGEQDALAWVDVFNQSFIDHWNHHPITVENLKHWLIDPNYRQELDLIAIAADGTFAAFCYSAISPEENLRTGRNEGYVEVLGTRRGFRRMGLGKAMLLSGLHQLKSAGVDTARIGVDSENPNGALLLYESVGFRKVDQFVSYVKDVVVKD